MRVGNADAREGVLSRVGDLAGRGYGNVFVLARHVAGIDSAAAFGVAFVGHVDLDDSEAGRLDIIPADRRGYRALYASVGVEVLHYALFALAHAAAEQAAAGKYHRASHKGCKPFHLFHDHWFISFR